MPTKQNLGWVWGGGWKRKISAYSVKKGYRFSRPQPGCHSPNSPWPGINKLFPASERVDSDIPAGDRKNYNLFYSVKVRAHER